MAGRGCVLGLLLHLFNLSLEFPYPPNRRMTKTRPLLDYWKDLALHTHLQPMGLRDVLWAWWFVNEYYP